MSMNKYNYIGSKKACEILGVHFKTLLNWEKGKKIEVIRTPGGKRLYNVDSYIKNNINIIKEPIKRNICYCRVSTAGQKDDLKRQQNFMKEKYPNYEIISDIGSGLNNKRKGLKQIIKYAINGEINEVIIAYKDRLSRFGFDLIEDLINEYSNGKIIVLEEKNLSPNEELTKDLISIINVFSARINGLRKYKTEINSNKKFK